MFRKSMLVVLLISAMPLLAEYQVFGYSSSFKKAELNVLEDGGHAYGVTSDSLKGYLVTVCCYPCQADFGKSYPSWLYVFRKLDAGKYVWQVPVKVDGGLLGKKSDSTAISELYDEEWLTPRLEKRAKLADKAWFRMEMPSDYWFNAYFKSRICQQVAMPYGMFGWNSKGGTLVHTGFGSSGFKYNRRIEQYFNPYIASISGTMTGTIENPASSFDPSNFSTNDSCIAAGTFTLKFDKKMTERIRGYADWNIIDSIILKEMKAKASLKADEDWELWE